MADITVTEHLLLHQKRTPQATGQFTGLLYDLILSGKSISRRINKAGLLDILGGTGEVNVQGENVQKLDTIANRILLYRMERCGALCAMSSEEEAELIRVSPEFPRGDYILIFDPLDGSSNIDVNINVGTIFSILRRPEGHSGDVTLDAFETDAAAEAASDTLFPATPVYARKRKAGGGNIAKIALFAVPAVVILAGAAFMMAQPRSNDLFVLMGHIYKVVGCFLLYLAIVKEFEPLILLPMAFGMILANLPGSGVIHMQYFVGDGLEHPMWVEILNNGGLADMLYMGVKLGIYPPLIFLGIGTMTDFAPLISNPKSLLLGAAAQFGIFGTYMGARLLTATGLVDFTQKQSAAIAIIGGADGPTAIFVTSRLAPELLGSIAVAAYSYMALVPVIQPPIMKALTTSKERSVVMKQLRTVSKTERIIFPIMVAIIVSLIVPDAAVLVGMLMLGNLMKECGVVDRIQKTAGNELMNIITIFLALSVGCTTSANTFLNTRTLFIIVLGLIAFSFGTAAGVLCGKVMYKLTGGQVNPLIGSAGVSAVPMAARVSQKVGQSENPSNFLLMHAMGPNVAGVIGSAIAAGVLISLYG